MEKFMSHTYYKTIPRDLADFFENAIKANPKAKVTRKDNADGTVTFTVVIQEEAWASTSATVTSDTAGGDSADFDAHITGLGLKHFRAAEFLVKGSSHSSMNSPAFGLNTDPPRSLWSNVDEVAKIVDKFRNSIGRSVVISSAYRSPAYNEAIGGAVNSRHMHFDALDVSVNGSPVGPLEWAAELRQMRNSGLFKGGIGTYRTFVHIDTRGKNVDWIG
jgi:hypothetical protein